MAISDHRGADVSPSLVSSSSSPGGCLPVIVRLGWIFGGISLLFCALFIIQGKAPVVSDAIYFAFTLGILVLRFVDIRFLHGETTDNQPATMAHWRRYAVKTLIVSALLYAAAKALAGSGLLR